MMIRKLTVLGVPIFNDIKLKHTMKNAKNRILHTVPIHNEYRKKYEYKLNLLTYDRGRNFGDL